MQDIKWQYFIDNSDEEVRNPAIQLDVLLVSGTIPAVRFKRVREKKRKTEQGR